MLFPGNNHLGGQDFNLRLFNHLKKRIESSYSHSLTHVEDLQNLHQLTEVTKLRLTDTLETEFSIDLHDFDNSNKRTRFRDIVTRQDFEAINADLLLKVLEPIRRVLKEVELNPDDVDEIVLVGGSTRIPYVRHLIEDFFGKQPNTAIDPELAVVSGVAIQAGILGGVWPLTVSAVELPTKARKINVN